MRRALHHTRCIEACVDDIVSRFGSRVVLALPLGVGKANRIANALYRRAVEEPSFELEIHTALSVDVPSQSGELRDRLLQPIFERTCPGHPGLDYLQDRRAGRLPRNVRVYEFFLAPGEHLEDPIAQRDFVSSNYATASRDAALAGVDVIAQSIAVSDGDRDRRVYSLGSNPDITLDLRDRLGDRVMMVGEVNRQMPFMYGDARVPAKFFDVVVDDGGPGYALFGPPSPPVDDVDAIIGMRTSALVPDGGTLQLGIGGASDAVAHALRLRHRDNLSYRRILGLILSDPERDLVRSLGGVQPFETGLYASSEMMGQGLFELYRAGVVRRKVHGDLDAMARAERGESVPGGTAIHAGFFFGPPAFYRALAELTDEERAEIAMSRISFTNTLFGQEHLKRAQRRHARFINAAMKATVDGGIVSDQLADGRTVGGIGGQHDFVTMAHALEGARSIVSIRSSRADESNVVWGHPHLGIPRHLRDIVVTEYGIADLRGKSDAECVAAMIEIADARFAPELLQRARSMGRLPPGYRLPERCRSNTPEMIAKWVAQERPKGTLPLFPFGTELTELERELGYALKSLSGWSWDYLSASAVKDGLSIPGTAGPYLERLGLAHPEGLHERALRRIVVYALSRQGLLGDRG